MPSDAETNLLTSLLGLDARWSELTGLLEVARGYNQEDPVHESLCRSISVLLCAHMEGAIKSVSMAVIADVNDNNGFTRAPASLKRAFVRYVLLDGMEISEDKVSNAANALGSAQLVIDGKKLFSANHNPKASVIERYASHFGVAGILGYFTRSKPEDVFASDEDESLALVSKLRSSCFEGAASYPYGFDPMADFSLAPKGRRKQAEGLFGNYLDAVLSNRHDIAHGNELKAAVGARTLRGNVVKAQALVYGYTQIIGQAMAAGHY